MVGPHGHALAQQQHPSTGDLFIAPSRHDIRPDTKNQVEVVWQDRKADQVDPETGGELTQIAFDPDLAMIEVLPRDQIVAEQKATRVTRE